MGTGLPSKTQVTELLEGEFARVGYEIEDVVINARARPPRITIVADSDAALDLDTAAELSRRASALLDELALLDGLEGLDSRYTLEVSSPGVERPLTSARHFRRAQGRRVEVALTDGSRLTGRVGATGDDVLTLVVRSGRDWTVREIAIDTVVEAVVQVEFSPPAQRELELAGRPANGVGTETGA